MAEITKTGPFILPDVGVPISFAFDTESELLWLEIYMPGCYERKIREDSPLYIKAKSACENWGQKSCSSRLEANRLIQNEFPQAVAAEAIFLN